MPSGEPVRESQVSTRLALPPADCKEGSSHPSAKVFPLSRSNRHLALYDPKTQKLTHVNTCFGTHHLMFAADAKPDALDERRRPGGRLVDRKLFEQTGDETRSQGWTALIMLLMLIMDTSGKCQGPLNGPKSHLQVQQKT